MLVDDITAIVLCGGSGRRLGAVDKTLVSVGGRPLVAHTLAALQPQVGHIVISCGRDAAAYASFPFPTAPDERPGEGPLGGIVSALGSVQTEWILTYPGDTPFADQRLVERLALSAERDGVAVPHAGDYRQHLVMLLSRATAAELMDYYEAGGRAVKDWLDQRGIQSTEMTDIADSFFNVNTPDDLEECERRLAAR